MIIFGNNMLVQVFLSLLLLESVYAAGPVIPMRRKRSRWSMPPAGSFISMKRASCYHDVAFYYNAALLARPKSETAWLEPWVRGAWGHHVKHFGGCAVPRINTGTSGTRCENFGAPKPLVVFLFLSNAAYISWAGTRFHEPFDGSNRNVIKIEETSFTARLQAVGSRILSGRKWAFVPR
ncbi:hypothetical protein DFS34DRAFT_250468 [Phlyctochytrium arcticum]|nr:hypothetical protein DFS34DRAFT_250468 [Phlyctochytrium arcticum]